VKVSVIISKVIQVVAYAVAAIVLLLCGISILLYSPWTQTLIRDGALKML